MCFDCFTRKGCSAQLMVHTDRLKWPVANPFPIEAVIIMTATLVVIFKSSRGIFNKPPRGTLRTVICCILSGQIKGNTVPISAIWHRSSHSMAEVT